MNSQLQNRQDKKPRAYRPKVKSGCLTCKARRVKCDETKPSCLQCARVRRTCEGYGDGETQNQDRTVSTLQRAQILVPHLTELVHLEYAPTSSLFKDNQEHFCFRHFCSSTSRHLGGPFQSELWGRLIPQASVVDTSIRHAVIAIAAISLIPKGNPRSAKDGSGVYHQFALLQYSKALLQMRIAASKRTLDLRTVLITSILIICFETFHGNRTSAFDQLRTGLALINTMVGDNDGSRPCSADASLPTTCIVERELVEVYARLEVNFMMIMRSRPGGKPITMSNRLLKGRRKAPESFMSVEEARIFLEGIQRRLVELRNSNTAEDGLSTSSHPVDTRREPPASYLQEREYLLNEILQWCIAFDPILQKKRTSGRDKELYGALILRLRYLTIYYAISALPNKTPAREHDFIPLFAEIISLSRTVLQNPDMVGITFTIDGQTVKPLFIVALPRREGFWDAALCGKVAHWVTSIEEEDSEGGYVLERSKIQSLSVDANLQKRTAHTRCLQRDKKDPITALQIGLAVAPSRNALLDFIEIMH
ncbi:hypothetical protein V495_01421 [Pseudogymnoascus sp. VKM F-4514 (FW-929)]|nr:hypothetical protein V495_01421 [Pseudogymnoascus sp. VKM F-4514 (FW-929)]KFY51657.1 hypothetical protein V497_08965 [Pseudogymnoascus sp. VKM F-4516 (FW-969)]